ncbi:hypothetical protein HDG32_000638 [Paraburkholderia sp. CI2]|nr:hypothetical protein [Paraburkholderia sp. CI2]
MPTGSTAENLLRIDRLITEFEPATLVFLGDLLHARESLSTLALDALHAWRARHASRRVVLVEGNHDRHAGALPLTLDVESVREPWHIGRGRCAITRMRSITRMCSRGMCIRSIRSRRGSIQCACRAFALGSIGGCCRRSVVLPEARVRRGAFWGRGFFWWYSRE